MNTGYKADRKVLYEAVKFWKGSPLYRAEGLQTEGEAVTTAPWLVSDDDDPTPTIVSRWAAAEDVAEGAAFEDVAVETSIDGVVEMLAFIADRNESEIVDLVLSLLEENEGQLLYLGRPSDPQAFAIMFTEGRFVMAEMEIDEDLIDEGLISMNLLATTVPDPNAPVVPGFAPIEQRLYEMLHAAEVIGCVLSEEKGSTLLREQVGRFSSDLTNVIVEMVADQGSLTDKEVGLVSETFGGAYAGIVEEAKRFTA